MATSQAGEPLYCVQQINIPPSLPHVLKLFTKAAIREQPEDVLQWAADYFNSKSTEKKSSSSKPVVNDIMPLTSGPAVPAAEVPEVAPVVPAAAAAAIPDPASSAETKTLSYDVLLGLKDQLLSLSDGMSIVSKESLEQACNAINFPSTTYGDVMGLGSFEGSDIPWLHFYAITCTLLAGDMTGSLEYCCKSLGNDNAEIPYAQFKDIYEFLADIDGEVTGDVIENALAYLSAKELVGPKDFLSEECPPLNA